MSIVVETGAGLTNADSSCSVAAADAYFTNLGNTSWTGSTSVKEDALKVATQYIELRFGTRWFGVKKTQEQSLSWPRQDVTTRDDFEVSDTSVPTAVVNATAEMALRSIQGDVFMADVSTPGSISEYEVKVGPIAEKTKYLGGQSSTKAYPKLEAMLADLASALNEIKRA